MLTSSPLSFKGIFEVNHEKATNKQNSRLDEMLADNRLDNDSFKVQFAEDHKSVTINCPDKDDDMVMQQLEAISNLKKGRLFITKK